MGGGVQVNHDGMRTGERGRAIASRPQPLTFTLMAEAFKSFSILKVFHIKVAPPLAAQMPKPLVRMSGAGKDAVSRSGSLGSPLKMLPP